MVGGHNANCAGMMSRVATRRVLTISGRARKGRRRVEMITAIHEAGHAVAFSRLFPSRQLSKVSIIPDHDEGFAGACSSEGLWGNEDVEHLANHDVYGCSGYAAVFAAGNSEEEAAAGCESDFEEVFGDLNAAKARALDLMRQPSNLKAVKRVADELVLRKALHPDHVDLLIGVADGELPEREYLQLLVARGWNNSDATW